MPGLKAPARRHTETARGDVPDHDGLSSQERRLLRKRFRSELEVVRGFLKKAEVLVAGKAVNSGAAPSKARPAPRRGKNGWFLPAEARPEADMACAKRRKTNPLVEVIEPRMSQRAARPTGRITDLIARAQEEKRSKCRELDRKRAREELQEMERTALPSDSIHPRDMVLLGIAAVEYIVSSDDETSPVRSMWGKLRLGPGRGSLVQQLGLILKADYHGGEEEEQDLEGELR